MLKNISQLAQQINSKEYKFLCDSDSPIQDVKEFAFQVIKFVGKIEDGIKQQQELEASKQQEIKEEIKQE